jgi:hypothetical protein
MCLTCVLKVCSLNPGKGTNCVEVFMGFIRPSLNHGIVSRSKQQPIPNPFQFSLYLALHECAVHTTLLNTPKRAIKSKRVLI